jgi:two-component system heavy metal sensor histidine kinase CusS
MTAPRAQISRARLSVALRIALASALFGLVVAVGSIGVGYWALSRQLDDRSAEEISGRRELLEHILAGLSSAQAVEQSKSRFSELFYGHDDLHLALAEPEGGEVLARFSDVAVEALTVMSHAAAPPDAMHNWTTPAGVRFSGIHGTASLSDGHRVRFYLSVDRHRDAVLLAGFVKATLLALPLLLLTVALGAGLIARTGLAPLRGFNRLAASTGARSLNQRLEAASLPPELADLATEFNGMLDRIDHGYRRLEDFAGDLAHEMRTPVATLLGRTQVALSQTRSAVELREVLEGNVEELERLARLISDMLFIARAEHDAIALQPEPVELAKEAQRVADYLSLVAEERGLRLEVTGNAPALRADRLLVQRAITNLVSNGLRHARERSTVVIGIVPAAAGATLSVTNQGDTIPPEHLDRIFARFYRADTGRSRMAGGAGLGLAIVRSIAHAHGGEVGVRSEAGVTTFTLSLPGGQAA